MSATFSAIPLTGVPFPKSEYEGRQQKVLTAMARVGLDAILVTAHSHLQYLTGYDGHGGWFAPFPLILVPGRAPTFVVREFELGAVRAESCVDEIIPYVHQDDFAKVCGDVLRRYGLRSSRVGLELDTWNLAPADVSALQAQLPELKVTDATRLVATVAAVMSDLELEVMRAAMAMTDLAVRTVQNSLRDGVTEAEVLGNVVEAVNETGGELWPECFIVFGERTRLPHGRPKKHPIRNNEPAYMEVAGSKHGYGAGLLRCAVLGRHAQTEYLHALAEEALSAAIDAIKPGVTASEVDAAARKVIERSGHRARLAAQRAGYGTGIHWSARGYLSLGPGAADIIEAGMTFHMPIVLVGEGGHYFGCGEHIVVTERGAEMLSTTPRTLYRA